MSTEQIIQPIFYILFIIIGLTIGYFSRDYINLLRKLRTKPQVKIDDIPGDMSIENYVKLSEEEIKKEMEERRNSTAWDTNL